jgi:hypothetical protein
VGWERLEDQLGWYERKSAYNQRAYKWLKLVEIIVAATIPVIASLDAARAIMAALGALVVVLEGGQQLFQYHANWITYRSTAEALKHERYLYLATAGPYAGTDRERVLAERVEGLVSQEHARWTSSHLSRQPADNTAE